MFAAAQNRADAITVLLARGADAGITTKTIDLAHQLALDRAATERQRKILEASVPKGQQPTPSQVQAAVQAARELYASGKIPPAEKKAPADPNAPSAANNFDPEEINPPVASKGGLTALLHAARQGNLDAARALLDGGAAINQVGAGDATSPLLMAAINGQFDMAMFLIERGANPNLAASGNGVTPLWAAINTQWQPRTRFPQPQEMEKQKTTYLDVDGGAARGRARTRTPASMSHPWYMVYSGCGNRNCGLADTSGSTAFWRAAYATDLDAMRLLAAYGADPNIPTIAPQQAVRRGPPPGAPAGTAASVPGAGGPMAPVPTATQQRFSAPAGSVRRARRARDPRRRRRRVRRRLRRQRASSRARRVAGVGEVPGRGARRRRQRARQRRLHAAAPRRRARRQRADPLSRVEGRRRDRGRAQRPDDGRHGQRPGAARLADSRRRSRCSRSSDRRTATAA